jgi:hypothetical protein
MEDKAYIEYKFYNSLIDIESYHCNGHTQQDKNQLNYSAKELICWFSVIPEPDRQRHFDEAKQRLQQIGEDGLAAKLEAALKNKKTEHKNQFSNI